MSAYKLDTNKYKLGKTNSVKQLSTDTLEKKLADQNTPNKYRDHIKKEIRFRKKMIGHNI